METMKCILILCMLKASIVLCGHDFHLKSITEWKQVDYNFPNMQTRQEAIDKGWFIPQNVFPLDVDVDYIENDRLTRIFVTTPRFSEGVPVTLGFIAAIPGAKIQPYPDYSWHSNQGANCDAMTSVLRIAIDECRRLWVVDTGKIGSTQHCPPQLLAFDLATNRLILRYKFPKEQYTDASLFISPLVDIRAPFNVCSKTKVYIPDVNAFALIVYDFETNKSWKIQNKLFYPNPNFGTFTIADESFDLMDGIFGIAMKKEMINNNDNLIDSHTIAETDKRLIYFHSLSSNTENTVPLSVINNQSLWENDSNAVPRAFKEIGSRNSQTSIETIDSNGNMWFVLTESMSLACWDTSKPYNQHNIKIVLKDVRTLQFASGLKLVKNLSGLEELWIVTIRIQKIYAGTMSFDETNYRVQTRTIDYLLRGSKKCNNHVHPHSFSHSHHNDLMFQTN